MLTATGVDAMAWPKAENGAMKARNNVKRTVR